MARTAKRSFKYQPPSEKALKERANRQGGNFDSIFKQGVDTWRPKAGDNYIRILPATWDNPEHYALSVWMHRGIGPDNSTYLCLDKMKGKPCPICEAAVEAKGAGEDDEAKELKAKENFLCYVIDRDEKKPKPMVWTMSWTMDRDFAALAQNKKGGVINIDDPENGYDISFKRTGEKLRTRYSAAQIERDSTPVDDNERRQSDILGEIEENPLDKILVYKDYDYLEKMLSGTASKKDDDLDEDDKPSRRRSAKDDDDEDDKPRARRRGGDDDEDDKPSRRRSSRDDDEEEDKPRRRASRDDDEDEKPARRRSRNADDDEEEDKPARRRPAKDDDDEDEPPRRRRAAAKDDDEEEDKPTRRRSSRDDDDEEEDDTRGKSRRGKDEDEDEAPRRRRR